MKRIIPALFILIITLLVLGYAESEATLELDALIEEARANNPELVALKAEHEAAQARTPWTRYLIDPVVAAEFGENMRMYSLTLPLPFPTKITSRTDLARTEADYYHNLYLSKGQEVIRDVKKNYAVLFLLYGNIATIEKSVYFMKQIYSITAHKYSISEASQAEVLRAQVELARSENKLVVLQDDLSIAEARINTLLNQDIDTELGKPAGLETTTDTLALPALYRLAEENHPLLKAYRYERRQAEVMLSMARQTYLPDLTLRYKLEHMDNDVYNNKYMVGITVPVWFWGKQREFVREAEARLNRASAHYQTIENKLRLAVKEAKIRIQKLQHTVDLYRNSILPQAEAGLQSALAAYEVNKIEFESLLASEKLLIQSEFEHEEARVNLFKAVADLEEAVGLTD
jgi:outer membrane protein TolC